MEQKEEISLKRKPRMRRINENSRGNVVKRENIG